MHQSPSDDVSGGWGCPLPKNSITEALYILGATIDFIDCWLKALEHNVLERYIMYAFNTKNCFRKPQLKFINNPVQIKNENHYYMLLEVVGK